MCMYAYVCVCMYVACMYVCMYVSMYLCSCICICICIMYMFTHILYIYRRITAAPQATAPVSLEYLEIPYFGGPGVREILFKGSAY